MRIIARDVARGLYKYYTAGIISRASAAAAAAASTTSAKIAQCFTLE